MEIEAWINEERRLASLAGLSKDDSKALVAELRRQALAEKDFSLEAFDKWVEGMDFSRVNCPYPYLRKAIPTALKEGKFKKRSHREGELAPLNPSTFFRLMESAGMQLDWGSEATIDTLLQGVWKTQTLSLKEIDELCGKALDYCVARKLGPYDFADLLAKSKTVAYSGLDVGKTKESAEAEKQEALKDLATYEAWRKGAVE